MRIAVLNNLRAGRSARQVSRVLGFLRGHAEVLHVETDSARAVPEALADLARQGVDVLAVNGGDGTLLRVLTELLEEDSPFEDGPPLLAPLRGGRTNMSAHDLGAQRDPVKGIAALLRADREGRMDSLVVERPVLRVAHGSGARRRVACGMFFGAGMIHRAVSLSHRVFPHGQQGVAGSTLLTGGLIARQLLRGADGILAPDKLQAIVDGTPIDDGEFSLVIATSLSRLFARMRPFLGSEPAPVRFTAVATGAHRLTRSVVPILRGRRAPWVRPENGYHSANAHRVVMRMSCGFTVDGELFAPEPDRIVSLGAHERVRFLRA